MLGHANMSGTCDLGFGTRVDHSKAFLCTTCGWGFFVLGLFTFKG